MTNNLRLNLRLDERTHDALLSLSALDNRSMSATIRHLIRQERNRRMTTDKPVYSYDGDAPAPVD